MQMIKKTVILFIILLPVSAFGISNQFPVSTDPPTVDSLLPSPAHTYYCSPTGDNSTGDGSISDPWYDLIGASGNISAGDLIYFRGGNYTKASSTWALSDNRMNTDASSDNPIVITNYPGEQVIYNDTSGWCMSISGNYQYLIGTKVGTDYGIKITGGITVTQSNTRVSGVEFINGADNGGDVNPAMISQPYNGSTFENILISHNRFYNSQNIGSEMRMAPIRLFAVRNPVIEYNIFKDCNETSGGGCIFHKDNLYGVSTIRYNKFISCESAITFGHQGTTFENMSVHHNLFYDVERPIENRRLLVTAIGAEIAIYNNVALNCRTGFYYYQNNAGYTSFQHNGDIYNNVIDGYAIRQGSNTELSAITQNLPDKFENNLWYNSGDQKVDREPSDGLLTLSIAGESYFTNAVISADAVTYSSELETCTVADDYVGRTAGRNGDCIGGFVFGSPPDPDPSGSSSISFLGNSSISFSGNSSIGIIE